MSKARKPSIASHVGTRSTPQSERIPGPQGARQVANSAGGFSFGVDKWKRLERFLILGSEGGSYYASERALTRENAQIVYDCASEDFQRTLDTVVDVSVRGRAPKQQATLLAYALLCSHEPPNSTLAFEKFNDMMRIPTFMFDFMEMFKHLRGRGRSLRRALKDWYLTKEPEKLAYLTTKYQQRNGWSHRDILRLSKPPAPTPEFDGLFAYATGGDWQAKMPEGKSRSYLEAVEICKNAESHTQIVNLIRAYQLPWEVIPTEFLTNPAVWEALLDRMPATALIRNLGRMSAVGTLKPFSTGSGTACAKLADGEWLRKSRVHPLSVLVAMGIYARGRALKGSLTWTPDSNVVDALDGAFYDCFENVEPTGKRLLLALDCSGSMGGPNIAGTYLSPRECAAAMAMVAVRSESQTHVCAFTAANQSPWKGQNGSGWFGGNGITPVALSKKSRLDDAVKTIYRLPMGGTDCALPMLYALDRKLEVDAFVVYTDSETWAGGKYHPVQALQLYREKTGIPAKLIVVGLVANNFSIADQNDSGMLDVVGFDTAAPAVMSDFIRE